MPANTQNTQWNNYSYTPYGNNVPRQNQYYYGNQQYNYNQANMQNNNAYYQQQAQLAAQHGNSAVQQNKQFANYRSGKSLESAKKRKLRKNRDPAQLFQEAKVRALRHSLRPPASWLPGSEISLYAKMNIPASKIQSNSITTFLLTFMFLVICVIAGTLTTPLVYLAVPIVPFLVLSLDTGMVKSKYKAYQFYRQLLFSKFSTILDLSEVKRGLSINELLTRAAKRMNNKDLSDAVNTLNSRIEDNPTSSEPYMSFADQFSDTPDARLYMASVFRMSRGFYDDSEIHSLKVNSGKDLMYQSRVLMKHKLGRFRKVRTILFCGFATFLIYFLLSFIVITVLQLV